MLSACIATLKRAVPLLTWTEVLTISPHLPVKKAMIVTYQLYFTVFSVSSEIKPERENMGVYPDDKAGRLGGEERQKREHRPHAVTEVPRVFIPQPSHALARFEAGMGRQDA